VADAYAQCGILGRALASDGGTEKLGRLLDAFSDNTFFKDLFIEATAQHREDEALRQVYGYGVKKLFKTAAQ
jgi:hypothetical protein